MASIRAGGYARAVGWYLRFSLSYRHVEELLAERGRSVNHVTVWRWVEWYALELDRACATVKTQTTLGGWTRYVRVKGKWVYLYRVVDSTGATIVFLLSARRDARRPTAFDQSLGPENYRAVGHQHRQARWLRQPVELKAGRVLERSVLIDRCSILITSWNRITGPSTPGRASQDCHSFWGACRTIAGYEAIHMIRKGQAYGSAAGTKVGLLHRFILGLFAAAN